MERTLAAAEPAGPPPSVRAAWALWGGYLAAIGGAELLGFISPLLTLGAELVLVCAIPLHASMGARPQPLLLALVLVPLVRVASFSLPLTHLPVLYWYALSLLPLVVAALAAARLLGLSRQQLGLVGTRVPLQLAIGLLGVPLGMAAYLVFQPPRLLADASGPGTFVVMVGLLTLTGLLAEFIFRGVLQVPAEAALGRGGLVYVSALFAVLHLGHGSLVAVAFAFGVGLGFAWLVWRTSSLLGVSLAHAALAVLCYLLLPALLTQPPSSPLSTGRSSPSPAPIGGSPSVGSMAPAPAIGPEASATRAPLPLSPPAALGAPDAPPETVDGAYAEDANAAPGTAPENAEALPEPELGEGTIDYTVRPGDTLFLIAQANDTTVSTLLELNTIGNPTNLSVGTVLRVPTKPAAE